MESNIRPFISTIILLALAASLCSWRSDKSAAKRNLRHQQNHYYVRSKIHIDRPSFFPQTPHNQILEFNFFTTVIGAIAHSHH